MKLEAKVSIVILPESMNFLPLKAEYGLVRNNII